VEVVVEVQALLPLLVEVVAVVTLKLSLQT
jgi:hypothetical protein